MTGPDASAVPMPSTVPNAVELTICSRPAHLPVVRAAVERLACDAGFCEQDAKGFTWALDEALANVIRHGYENAKDRPIQLRLEPARAADGRGGLQVTVRDYGRQVDPCTIRGRDLEDVRPGGLGVHIIESVMDEVEYSCPAGGGMLLRMVKFVPAAPACAGGDAPKVPENG